MGVKKPTGLKIKRDGVKFTFSWSRGEKYDGQLFEYKLFTAPSQEVANSSRSLLAQGSDISGTKWIRVTINHADTSKAITLTASNYYPTTNTRIYGIAFRIKGYVNNTRVKWSQRWSSPVTKTMIINPPKVPGLTVSYDVSISNRSSYSWTAVNEETYPATNVEYQTVTKTDCPADIKGLAEWNSAVKTTKALTGGPVNYDETGLVNTSKTRVVRVRARGLGGYSGWSFAKHVFAAPYAPQISTQNAVYDPVSDIWNITATWTTPTDAGHPVDNYVLQYRIGKPAANMGVTEDNSWQDTATTTRGAMSAQFTETLDDDECLWLRAAASHDNHTGQNAIVGRAVRAYTGKTAAPSALTISASDLSSRTVTIGVDNNSDIVDSKVAIVFQPSDAPSDSVIVAVLSGSGSISQSGIKCPDWANTGTLGFRAFSYVGSETYETDSQSVKRYNVIPVMQSDAVFTAGGIPKAPATCSAEKDGEEIEVKWDWTWEDANAAEVSWSKNKNAWNSNKEPETYKVSSTGPAHLYIADVDMGEVYYVKVRLLHEDDNDITYGPYSATMRVEMIAEPVMPVLYVSSDVLKPEEELGLSWVYTSSDGTPQAYAEVAEKSGATYTPIGSTETAQELNVQQEWTANTQHALCVRVVSESGISSPWSDPVTVTVADPPVCTITQTSLVAGANGYELQEMPFTITVTGAGTAGQTRLKVIRLASFALDRPDEEALGGYAGQLVTERVYSGEAQQTIELDDVIEGSSFDDTAEYRILASVTDGYGITDSTSLDFTVNWSHQPVMPEATVAIVDTAAYITLAEPAGASNTDTIDIYRLSVDKPQLIYKDAALDDVIVDPYPTIGRYGGYRVVLKTKDGDYYTTDKEPAWIDIEANFETASQFIDFDGYEIPLNYNVELDSSFTKDFKKTTYLGGHEEGDFLEAIDRSGTMSGVMITEQDVDDIKNLRRLAQYKGLAHIRTKGGSSYAANINISSEHTGYASAGKTRTIDLNIEACKAPRLDGMTQEEWEA